MKKELEKLSYTTPELVGVTGVNKDYWRMLQRLGIVKPFRLGKKDIWLKKDIDNFFEWARYRDVSNETSLIRELAKYEQRK